MKTMSLPTLIIIFSNKPEILPQRSSRQQVWFLLPQRQSPVPGLLLLGGSITKPRLLHLESGQGRLQSTRHAAGHHPFQAGEWLLTGWVMFCFRVYNMIESLKIICRWTIRIPPPYYIRVARKNEKETHQLVEFKKYPFLFHLVLVEN